MKKFLALAVIAFAFAANSFAQYDRVYVSYAPTKESANLDGGTVSSETIHGIEAGYFHGFGISKSAPLFLEVGANVQYNSKEKDNVSMSLCSIKVPVNITYKLPVGSNMALAPYGGVNVKFNAVGETKVSGKKISHFSEDEDLSDKANRLQMGYQVGLNFYISDFYVGAGYQGDITEYARKLRHNGFVATVGYSF